MMPEASLCSLSQGVGLTAEVLLKCSWQSQGHTHTHMSCRSVPKYSSQNTSAWHWTQRGFRYHSQLRAAYLVLSVRKRSPRLFAQTAAKLWLFPGLYSYMIL